MYVCAYTLSCFNCNLILIQNACLYRREVDTFRKTHINSSFIV